jgi:5-formyltetrahydrofolate cyclo-ligase
MRSQFPSKAEARSHVWDRLAAEGAARFPFPPHGRIPNFEGARAAAERLFEHEPWRSARILKVNPDAPQRPVRELALLAGKVVLMPTPRLRAGFLQLDPRRIPEQAVKRAAALSGTGPWARKIPLRKLPRIDAIVAGSVAVTPEGHRAGKGHGYADLEYAILRELGQPRAPVATTVHPLQIVGHFPHDSSDLPLDLIVTPESAIRVSHPPPAPSGIDWSLLTPGQIEEMPVLQELRRTCGLPPASSPTGRPAHRKR